MFLRSLFYVLLSLTVLPVAGDSASSSYSELNALLNAFSSIKARFQQTVYSPDDYLIHESSGHMLASVPGKLRWQVETPSSQSIITNGDTLWMYEPDLEQVVIKAVDPDMTATPGLLLAGSTPALERQYDITAIDSDGMRIFQLKPKAEAGYYKSLALVFNGRRPAGITIVDSLGQETRIGFTDVTVNEVIDPATYEFKPPPDIDVIRDE